MCKVCCDICGNEVPSLSIETPQTVIKLAGMIDINLCDYHLKRVLIDVQAYQWNLIQRLKGQNEIMLQKKVMQEIKEEFENEKGTEDEKES